ncbi:MAG: hypothetical protein ACJ748_10225, partial [Flavisolibacter sp.]
TFGFVGINSAHPVSTLDVRGTQFLSGQLKFGTGAHNIQFANPTATANKPMIFMFTSGTLNPTRMVIAHSTTYSNYGLQYNDSTDNFHFLGNGIPVLSVDLPNKKVSINSTLNLAGDVYQGSNRIIHVGSSNYNTDLGILSGGNTSGSYNTGLGFSSLAFDSIGWYNTATGAYSLYSNKSGSYNVANGFEALYSNTNGIGNTAIGYLALANNTAGSYNSGVGLNSMINNTTGIYNAALGTNSLYYNIDGGENTAIGYNTLLFNTVSNNTAIGAHALQSNSTGTFNTATGTQTLISNTTGSYNTANGYQALVSNITANYNTANGYQALYSNTTGSYNTANGPNSLYSNTTGGLNSASGQNSLLSNTTGSFNTASGYSSLNANTTGGLNSAFGYFSLPNNTTAFGNTGFGQYTLYYNATGNYNTAIGFSAGDGTTNPIQGTFLGSFTTGGANLTNMTAIGYNAYVDASNKVVVGNTAVTSIGGYANWTNFSDGRYKKNIKEDVPGLEFINQLRAVTYTIDVDGIEKAKTSLQKNMSRNEQPMSAPIKSNANVELPSISHAGKSLPGVSEHAQPNFQTFNTPSSQNVAVPQIPQIKQPESSEQDKIAKQEKAKIKYTGFVAQEVEKAAQKLGYDFSGVDAPKTKDGFYGLRYGDFVVPLVKAVQELSKKNEELQNKNDELEKRLTKLESIILDKKDINTIASLNLQQNTPNPAGNSTRIQYSIPSATNRAQLVLSNNLGQVIKTVPLNASGVINLDTSLLSSGVYNYSLIVDGKIIDTKKLVKASE